MVLLRESICRNISAGEIFLFLKTLNSGMRVMYVWMLERWRERKSAFNRMQTIKLKLSVEAFSLRHLPSVTYKCQRRGERSGCVSVNVWVCLPLCMPVDLRVCRALPIRVTFPSPSLSGLGIMMWGQHQTDNGAGQTDWGKEQETGESGAFQSDGWMDRLTDSESDASEAVIGWFPQGRDVVFCGHCGPKLLLIPWMSPTEYITQGQNLSHSLCPSSSPRCEFAIISFARQL